LIALLPLLSAYRQPIREDSKAAGWKVINCS